MSSAEIDEPIDDEFIEMYADRLNMRNQLMGVLRLAKLSRIYLRELHPPKTGGLRGALMNLMCLTEHAAHQLITEYLNKHQNGQFDRVISINRECPDLSEFFEMIRIDVNEPFSDTLYFADGEKQHVSTDK